MDWAKYSVVVTGGGGFIGSHLVETLVKKGARVRAFIHYDPTDDRGLLQWAAPEVQSEIDFVSGDLRDVEMVAAAVAGTDYVFHLGALVGIPYSYRGPRDVVETNVIGTLNVVQAARDKGVARVIHTSTSEVYGSAKHVPMREDHPLQGQSPYSASKIGADHLVESFWRSYGVPVSTVRPFNTYGPRQSARAIIPTVISQALTKQTLRLGSLAPTRDFNYVTDTVAGFLAVAETEEAVGEVINLGTGRETSIGQLVDLIGELTGQALVVEQDSDRLRPAASEVSRLLADASKARRLCGWEPRTSLEDGLRETISWVAARQGLYRPDTYSV